MGAFNIVIADLVCPACGKSGGFEVQYKYGHTRQLRYAVGSTITWGGNDIGRPGVKKVLVEGIGGPCPHCQTPYVECDVVIEHDRITDVRTIGLEWKEHYPEGYCVVEE